MCERCAYLEAENARLRAEIVKLKWVISRLREVIKRQRRQLDDVLQYVWNVMTEAGKIFVKRSGVPRHTWILWTGRNEVAARVYDIVKFDFARAILDAIQSI